MELKRQERNPSGQWVGRTSVGREEVWSESGAAGAYAESGVVAGVIEYIRVTTPDPSWAYGPKLGSGDAAGTCMP